MRICSIVRPEWLAISAIACALPDPVADSDGSEASGTDIATQDAGDGDGAEGDGTQADTGDDAGPFGDCGLDDDRYAPPPVTSPFGPAYAMDVVRMDATVIFTPGPTANAGSAEVDLTLVFTSPVTGGPTIFDLRQAIDAAWLDDEELGYDTIEDVEPSSASGSMRVLDLDVEPCTEHTLRLQYGLAAPIGVDGRAPAWGSSSVQWEFDFTDLDPGRFLEQWFPASLSFDRFAFTLDIEVAGGSVPHEVITNGDLTAIGNQFTIDFGASVAPHSPMLVLTNSDRLERLDTVASIPGGTDIAIELVRHEGNVLDTDLPAIALAAADALVEFSSAIGEYPHGDRLVVYLYPDSGGMEYDGGTTTTASAMRHEIFHMWWARGIAPATQDDGWIDEAWAVYNTGGAAGAVEAFAPDYAPRALHHFDPWSRQTNTGAYSHGADVFASLAAALGPATVYDAMREIHEDDPLRRLTTDALERQLYCHSADEAVRQHFHRWIYGRSGDAPLTSSSYCDPPR